MADSKNSKISELVELTDPSNVDYIPIVDTVNQETKKISYSSLITALNEDDDSYSKTESDALLAVNAAAIASEESRATAAEGVNATAISDETTRATAAEGVNATAISAETTRATAAEGVNATAISNETTRATAAEGVNATAISNETTRATAAEALLAPILDATFTGTTTIPSADITTADFNAGGLGGEVSWNNQEKTLDLVTGSDNVTVQLGQEVVLYARNRSGAAMSDGQVVMVDGSQGNNPTISLAQADTVANARKTIGVVTQSIPNNSNGFVTLIGKVRDLVLDNGTYSEGDVVYLSDTVAGGLTVVEPSISVEVGHVLATSNGGNTHGVLEVQVNNGAGTYELEQVVNANTAAIAINTAKVGITPAQASDIVTNNAKVGITPTQASEITANTAKVEYPYTTDFISGVEQTRNLTSITSSSGYSFNSYLTSIYVGSNVTSIGSSAFIYCISLISINIPDSVITLGSAVFYGCTSLTSIIIPDSVTSIGSGAFSGCSSLTSITIPDSVTSIGNGAFALCGSLTSATIGNSVTSIGNDAFYNCSSLSTINCLATTAPTLGTNAFLNVSATTIQVPVGAAGYDTTYGGLTVSYVL